MGRAGWAAVLVVGLFGCGGQSPVGPGGPGSQSGPKVVGRFAVEDKATHFTLPGTSISFHFRGTGLSVDLGDTSEGASTTGGPFHNQYQVIVDGTPTSVVAAQEGEHTYSLAQGLALAEHQVTLYKRTETMVGEGALYGYSVANGTLLAPAERSDRRIEFIGDSITAGYGDLGKDRSCSFTPDTEDHYLAYPAVSARTLGAEEISVAYAGRGVIRNLDGSTVDTLPELYGRALLDDPKSSWDFKQWLPQVVVIDLGTNDFETGVPDEAAFIHGYEGLISTVRGHYPKAFIFVALGPLLSDDYPYGEQHLTLARQFLKTIVADEAGQGDSRIAMIEFPSLAETDPMGCDWHPNVDTQKQMAAQLSSAIRDAVGW